MPAGQALRPTRESLRDASLRGAETIGPVLLGMSQPVKILPTGASVQQIVNLAALTALRAQRNEFVF